MSLGRIVGSCCLLACLSACKPDATTASSSSKQEVKTNAQRENGELAMTRRVAMDLTSRIKIPMTFAEIEKLIPLSTNIEPSFVSHGGVVYTVPVRDYFLQLRFEHPLGPRTPNGRARIEDCRLNYPPMLKERRDGPIINPEGLAPVKDPRWRNPIE